MSQHASHLSALFLATSLAALCGCAIDGTNPTNTNEDPTSSTTEALRNGGFSYYEPAVGVIYISGGMCTATLIDPQVIVTAAHCLDNKSGAMSGTFRIDKSATESHSYAIDQGVSYGEKPGIFSNIGDFNKDVAILHLTTPVPSYIATPMPISPGSIVSMGQPVTIYGYGCRATPGDAYSGHKQRYDYLYDDTIQVCPGDSGGPTIVTMANGVRTLAMVTYGWVSWWPGDQKPMYGLVYQQYWNIQNQIADWAGVPRPTPPSGGGGGGGGNNPSGEGPGHGRKQN